MLGSLGLHEQAIPFIENEQGINLVTAIPVSVCMKNGSDFLLGKECIARAIRREQPLPRESGETVPKPMFRRYRESPLRTMNDL